MIMLYLAKGEGWTLVTVDYTYSYRGKGGGEG